MTTDKDIPDSQKKSNSPDTLSAWERWQLPSMDIDVPVKQNAYNVPSHKKHHPAATENINQEEELKPLTADDLEAIRQAAYEDGLQQGLEVGKSKGYEEGLLNGESDVKTQITKLSQICRTLLEPIPKQDDELEKALLTMVEQICRRVVHRELVLDSKGVLDVVRESIDCLNPGSERLRIHLNSEDTEFVLQKLKDVGEWDESWRILAHPTITPGGCIIETDSSLIDARAERRLSTVIQQVYEQQARALDEKSQQHGHVDQLMDEVEPFQVDEMDDPIEASAIEKIQPIDTETLDELDKKNDDLASTVSSNPKITEERDDSGFE